MLRMRAAIYTKVNIRTNFSIFLYKTRNNTCGDSATIIFESFVDQKPLQQISSTV